MNLKKYNNFLLNLQQHNFTHGITRVTNST